MDNEARLKKKHIVDLVDFMKTSKRCVTVKRNGEDEVTESRQLLKDVKTMADNQYLEHSLFLGVMSEEDLPVLTASDAQ